MLKKKIEITFIIRLPVAIVDLQNTSNLVFDILVRQFEIPNFMDYLDNTVLKKDII